MAAVIVVMMESHARVITDDFVAIAHFMTTPFGGGGGGGL